MSCGQGIRKWEISPRVIRSVRRVCAAHVADGELEAALFQDGVGVCHPLLALQLVAAELGPGVGPVRRRGGASAGCPAYVMGGRQSSAATHPSRCFHMVPMRRVLTTQLTHCVSVEPSWPAARAMVESSTVHMSAIAGDCCRFQQRSRADAARLKNIAAGPPYLSAPWILRTHKVKRNLDASTCFVTRP